MSTETETITLERVKAITASLTAAGEEWAETARNFPELGESIPGDRRMRDRIPVIPEVVTPNGFQYASTLYRNEVTGEWHATGWSHPGQTLIYRPVPVYYDPDAGIWRYDDPETATDRGGEVMIDDYFTGKAREALVAAGGDPDQIEAIATWARDARQTGDPTEPEPPTTTRNMRSVSVSTFTSSGW